MGYRSKIVRASFTTGNGTYNAGVPVAAEVRLPAALPADRSAGAVLRKVVISTDNGAYGPFRLVILSDRTGATAGASFGPSPDILLATVSVPYDDQSPPSPWKAFGTTDCYEYSVDTWFALRSDTAEGTAGRAPGDLWLVVLSDASGLSGGGLTFTVTLGIEIPD